VEMMMMMIIIIIIKGIYIAQVRKGHKCAMSAEMAVWLRPRKTLQIFLHELVCVVIKFTLYFTKKETAHNL